MYNGNSLSEGELQRIIKSIAAAVMQSKPMQWVISQMPPDWTPGASKPEDVAVPARSRRLEQQSKFSRRAVDHAKRVIQNGGHITYADALAHVASRPNTVPASVLARDPAHAARFSRQARELAMRSIRSGVHMSFETALQKVMGE